MDGSEMLGGMKKVILCCPCTLAARNNVADDLFLVMKMKLMLALWTFKFVKMVTLQKSRIQLRYAIYLSVLPPFNKKYAIDIAKPQKHSPPPPTHE